MTYNYTQQQTDPANIMLKKKTLKSGSISICCIIPIYTEYKIRQN